jgi:hypothetical protein
VWISDGYVVIEIGFLGQIFSIEICNLSFSGTVRIAIDPNTRSSMPDKPVQLLKATFMKNPTVDVTVSFGDLLPSSSINAKVIGLGPIISQVRSPSPLDLPHNQSQSSQTINRIIRKKLVFPNWMQEVIIPANGSLADFSSCFVSPPIGVLTVQILRCRDLIIGDITSSDPFVEIHYLDEIYATPVIYKTLNPQWEEAYFDLIIYQTEEVRLKLVVFDHDFSQEPDYLGSIELTLDHQNLMTLQKNREYQTKKLINGDDGTIDFCLNYQLLASVSEANPLTSSQSADVLFNLPLTSFQNDFLDMSPTDHQQQEQSLTTLRGLRGVIVLSNIGLELSTSSHHNHTFSTPTASSSPSSSSHSFYISLSYQDMKKTTDVEKGFRDEKNHQLLMVPFTGVYTFIVLQQHSCSSSNSQHHQRGNSDDRKCVGVSTATTIQDHVVVKVTYKNKFGGKTACEIYFSIEQLLKHKIDQYEKNLVKNIAIGNLYSGQFKGKIQFIPIQVGRR